jgi:phage-related protein
MIAVRPVVFLKGSRRAIKKFPKQARKDAGSELFALQLGSLPHDWKPMPEIALGVAEIRIHEPHEHRVIYVAKFKEAVYALHAFEKKTFKTAKHDIDAARAGYAEMQKERQRWKKKSNQC